MTDRTCSKCGESKPESSEFFRSRGTAARGGLRPDCRVCSDARDKAYYAVNAERERLKRAVYRARTREQTRAQNRAYGLTAAGKARHRRAAVRYNLTEPGRLLAVRMSQERRAFKVGVGADFTQDQWSEVLDVFGHVCAYCGVTGRLAQEHVVPISKGGVHTKHNIVPACKPCNSQKFTTDMASWFRRQTFFCPDRLARIEAHTSI
jgi:5-methylcytosine-specific restriction endonuclease McrA